VRVLLAGFGSRGDVQPLIALGGGLQARGHDVRLLGSPNARRLAEARDLPFEPLGLDFHELLQEHADAAAHPVRTFKTLGSALRTQIDLLFEGTSAAMEDVDLAVGAPLALALSSAGEALGVPTRILLYAPLVHRTSVYPPIHLPLHGLPGTLNRALYSLNDAAFRVLVGGSVRRWRDRWELPVERSMMRVAFPAERCLLVTDPDLSPLPDDVNGPVQTAGLHLPQAAEPLDPAIEAFLAAGPAVYVGFGSMPDADARTTTEIVVEASRRAGVRVLLSRGWAQLGGGTPDHVLTVGATPHGALFPRLAGVVHHGGSGTTHSAARAGVPQLVIPHLMDQYYWRLRIDALGLGPRAQDRRRLTVAGLAAALEALTGGAHDEAARRQGERMAQRRGVATTVALLERIDAGD